MNRVDCKSSHMHKTNLSIDRFGLDWHLGRKNNLLPGGNNLASARASAGAGEGLRPQEKAIRPLEKAIRPLEKAIRPLEKTIRPLEEAIRPLEKAIWPLEQASGRWREPSGRWRRPSGHRVTRVSLKKCVFAILAHAFSRQKQSIDKLFSRQKQSTPRINETVRHPAVRRPSPRK